jgi:flagellar protein FlgJ
VSDLLSNISLMQAQISGYNNDVSQAKALSESASKAKSGEATDSAAEARMEKAATQFEAMLLKQMLGQMWKSAPSEGFLSGSREEQMFRDMLNDEMAKSIAESQSIGIKDIILREMREKMKS